jgi:hypothetical protein
MTMDNELKTPQGNQATYLDLRCAAYPPIEEQLDIIYHYGIDAWKEKIKKIKEDYPKENN